MCIKEAKAGKNVLHEEVDDYFKIILKMDNGVTAHIELSTYILEYQPRWLAAGDKGTMIVKNFGCDGSIYRTGKMLEKLPSRSLRLKPVLHVSSRRCLREASSPSPCRRFRPTGRVSARISFAVFLIMIFTSSSFEKRYHYIRQFISGSPFPTHKARQGLLQGNGRVR